MSPKETLVQRLRSDADEWNEADLGTALLEREAATEIEQLQNEVTDLRGFINGMRVHANAIASMFGLSERY
jgi:hypothetical protein